MRRWLQTLLTDDHARALDLLSEARDEVQAAHGTSERPDSDEVLHDAALAVDRVTDFLNP